MKDSAFILIGRKEKAGNTSRPGSFHQAYCFNVGEGATAVRLLDSISICALTVWIGFFSISSNSLS